MTMRSVQDRFWSDGWVRKLNPLDRYLFLYLITNEHTNWAGVYELELGMMAFESGLDERELERSMLPRLSPKVIYIDGWVYVPNWVKHHTSESGNLSPQQKEGVRKAFEKIPEKVRLKMKEAEGIDIPYVYPMVGVLASSLSLSSSLNAVADAPRVVDVSSSEGSERERTVSDALVDKAAKYWLRKCKEETGQEPSGGMAKVKKVVKEARKSLEFKQIKEMIDTWFNEQTLEPHELIQITRCLSPFQVDKYVAENI